MGSVATQKTPPVLFETMVFGTGDDQEQWRYTSLAAARAGHGEVVGRRRFRRAALPPISLSAPGRSAAVAAGGAAAGLASDGLAARLGVGLAAGAVVRREALGGKVKNFNQGRQRIAIDSFEGR